MPIARAVGASVLLRRQMCDANVEETLFLQRVRMNGTRPGIALEKTFLRRRFNLQEESVVALRGNEFLTNWPLFVKVVFGEE